MGCTASQQPQDAVSCFLKKLSVRPGNVLCASASPGPELDGTTLLVACGSLGELRSPNCRLGQLPDPLGAISRFLSLADDTSFPDDVLAGISAEGEAAYHRYGYQGRREGRFNLRVGAQIQGMH